MYDLPLQPEEVEVDIPDGPTAYMAPLTEAQQATVMDAWDTEVPTDEDAEPTVTFKLPGVKVLAMFRDNARRIPELKIQGEPFDPASKAHVARVPMRWKNTCVTAMITEANRGIDPKNSNAPDGP